MCNAVVISFATVSMRSLKTVPPQVVMFYNTMFGFSVSTVYILFEMLITGRGTRLAGYTARQYGFCTLSATFDVLSMSGG